MCRFFYFTSLAADYIFPKARGERRLTAPGFKPSLGSRPWRLRFRPQSGLVQRGVLYAAFGSGPSCWLAPPPSPLWEACHWILSRPRAPCESSSLATPLKRWNCGYWAVASIWVYGSRGEKTIQPGFARENKQTGLRPRKCTQTGLRPRKCTQTGLRPRKCTPFGANAPPFPRRGNFALLSASEFISISKRSAARISPSGGDVAAGDRRGAFPARRRRGCLVFAARGSATAAGGIIFIAPDGRHHNPQPRSGCQTSEP